MSKPSDEPEEKPGSPPRPLETNGSPQQPQSQTAQADHQSPPLNGNGDESNGCASSFIMSNASEAKNSPPAAGNQNPISLRVFPGAVTPCTKLGPSSPREANGSDTSIPKAFQPSKMHHEGHSPPVNPAAAKPVSTTSDEPEQPLNPIETTPVAEAAHSKPAHIKQVSEKAPPSIFEKEDDLLSGTKKQTGDSQTIKSCSSLVHDKLKDESESNESLRTDSKGPSSGAVNAKAHQQLQPRSAALELSLQTPPDSSETEAASISSNDENGDQASKTTIKFFIHPRAPTPPREPTAAELDLLLPSNETLPSDVEIDEDLDSDKGACKSAEMAKMTEDSSLFRTEAWKRLRESDMADNKRRAAVSKTAKSALLTLQKASAKYSSSHAVPIPVPKPQKPQLISPKPAPTPIFEPAPPPQLLLHQRMPSPPKHGPKPPPAAKKQYIPPKRAPPGYAPPGRAPPGMPFHQLARRHPTFIGGPHMAPPRPRTGYVPRAGSSFAPYGKMAAKVTKEQIREAIPENASCIFHILDRRVNLDSHAPDASFYSLLRSWVQDDPYRQMPPLGSNFLEYVTLPSERRVEESASVVRHKRKLPDTGMCDVFSELKNGKTPVSELSPKKLREELVAAGKRIKRQRQKDQKVQIEASRESLRRMGIVLPKK